MFSSNTPEREILTIPYKGKILTHTYYELGQRDRPTILMLHGAWHNGNAMYEYGRFLSTDYHVICIDLPNHYYYDPSIHFTLEEVIDSMYKGIKYLQSKGIMGLKPSIHAWSFGGSVAMELSAKYPNEFGELYLIAASPTWRHYPFPNVTSNFQKQFFMCLGYLEKQKYTSKKYTLWAIRNVKKNIADYKVCLEDNDILMQADSTWCLKKIQSKVTLIKPEFDKLLTPNICQQYRACVKDFEEVHIEKSGHLIIMENPVLLYEKVKSILQANMETNIKTNIKTNITQTIKEDMYYAN